MTKVIIGIDPDLHKSGFSQLKDGNLVSCLSMFMWEIFHELEILHDVYGNSLLGKPAWRRIEWKEIRTFKPIARN